MSIKSNQSKLKMQPMLFVALLLTGVACGVRVFQQLSQIDVATGFFKTDSVFNRVFLYAVPAFGVLWLILSYLSKDAGYRTPDGLQSKPLALFAALLAAGLAADCVQTTQQIRALEQVRAVQAGSMFATGEFALIGEAIFAALAVIYLLLLATAYFGLNTQRMITSNGVRLLALCPMLWAASRLIHHFLIKINFSRVSELFFELILLGFMTLFFLYFAQLNSNVYRDGFEWRVFGFGVPAALIAAMLSVARGVAFFVERSAVSSNYPFRPADCAFSLFAFAFLFVLLRQPQNEPAPEETEDEEEAN